ncbi:MAG: lamin tail domain-containing protein, partial [Planctomycetota bacterium]
MLRVLKVWLLMFLISLGGLAVAECPKGDLSGDCRVDFIDVRALASQWLYPSSWPGDLDGLNGVEARDWAILAEDWLQVGIPLVINEVLASNSRTNTDPQGQFDDWIEIYNAGNYPIDAGGMHLTDQLGNPTKWQIPTGIPATTTIQPGGYLLIWADMDITAPTGLHANFELNADKGDEVGLYDSNGVYIDSIEFPDQTPDISYGRFPDGNDTTRFLAMPTAKGQNSSAYVGQVADTKFSHDRGFYYSPFSVSIATETDGAAIYYTLDGSSPINLQTGAPTGTLYTGGIPIMTTTCLRAVALKNGWKPTNIDAQTYIFPNDVLKQATNQSTGAQVVPSGFPTKWDNGKGTVVTGDYQIDPDIVGHSSS